jgi:hypothetical protein
MYALAKLRTKCRPLPVSSKFQLDDPPIRCCLQTLFIFANRKLTFYFNIKSNYYFFRKKRDAKKKNGEACFHSELEYVLTVQVTVTTFLRMYALRYTETDGTVVKWCKEWKQTMYPGVNVTYDHNFQRKKWRFNQKNNVIVIV